MSNVRKERTGWRDENLSERHRRWGWDCPAIDLDLIFLEYDKGKTTALIEYKNEYAKIQYPSHPSFQALISLGDDAGVPVFGVRYGSDFSWWLVVPLNDYAKKHLPERSKMNEQEYVSFLYKIRGRELTQQIINNMNEPI